MDGNTIISNGFGDSNNRGDGDRLFDFITSEFNDFDLTLRNLTLQDGDVSCQGAGCDSGGGVINFSGKGELTLENVEASNNQNGCFGQDCGSPYNTAVLTFKHGGSLNIDNSSINNNSTYCESLTDGGTPSECTAGTTVLYAYNTSKIETTFNLAMQDTEIVNNTSSCDENDCRVEGIIETSDNISYGTIDVTDSQISYNALSCEGNNCNLGSIFYSRMTSANVNVDGLTMNHNRLECQGATCDSDYLFRIQGPDSFRGSNPTPKRGDDQLPFDLLINNSEFNHNTFTCTGTGCAADELLLIDESDFTQLKNSSIQFNELSCNGFGCDTDELIEICCSAGSHEIIDSVIANNYNHCEGNECDTDEILDIGTNTEEKSVLVSNTLVVDNEVSCIGAGCACDVAGIHLRAPDGTTTIMNSTIARNTSMGDDEECLNRASGGIRNDGFNTTITNSTIHGNRSVGSGAGILNSGGLILDHVTITDNQSDIDSNGRGFGSGICSSFYFQGQDACGIESEGDFVSLSMSNTVLDNQGSAAPDCYGLIESTGNNVINNAANCFVDGDFTAASADMQPLADNGCTETLYGEQCVLTQLASYDSPVIDAGDCGSGILMDQRGVNRPFDVTGVANVVDGCDIGAAESFSDLIFRNGFE